MFLTTFQIYVEIMNGIVPLLIQFDFSEFAVEVTMNNL